MSRNRQPPHKAKSHDRGLNVLQKFQKAFGDAVRHHRAGRIDEAIADYGRALVIRPHHAEAHNNLGTALAVQGRLADATTHYRRALSLNPNYVNAHSNIGLALAAQGKTDEALGHYERALILDPDHAASHHNLGLALAALGRIDEAAQHYQRAIALSPANAAAHFNLGQALMAQGQIADGVAEFERAIALDPAHAGARYNLATIFAERGDSARATEQYERVLAIQPDHFEALNNLGTLLSEQRRFDDAAAHFRRALSLNRDHPVTHNNLGIALAALGRIDDAAASYERALTLQPGYVHAHSNLGVVLAAQGRIDDAIVHYERALAIAPGHAEAHNNLGNLYKDQGKFNDAITHYERALAIKPDFGEAHLNRAEIKTFRRGDSDLAVLEAMAGKDVPPRRKLYLHFAMAKALEDTGDYAHAFEHLRQGNALKRQQINYDEASHAEFFRRVHAAFDDRVFDRFQGEGDPSAVPIFVLGMPRSGSSLIEQILASHPQVQGAGELRDFDAAVGSMWNAHDPADRYPERISDADGDVLRRIARGYLDRLPTLANGKVRIVDKTPGNFLYIGLIRLVLPNARIIHTLRDPLDTCVSCYSKLFTTGVGFSYDLAELGRYYRRYAKLMTHWRSVLPPGAMLDVCYEDVVGDLEGQVRQLLDYCALPWDDRCLSFHETSRVVKTASAAQVRKPLFRSSLQRWRRYEAGLEPLLNELRDVTASAASG